MNGVEKKELIKKTFTFLEKELLEELDESSAIIELSQGHSILGEGEYIRFFPMVISGCLRVTRLSADGNELLLYYLNRAEICAMSLTCCMGLQKSSIRMTAEESSLMLAVQIEKPEKWMSRYISWKEFMMHSYRKRFEDLIEVLSSIAFMQLDERLVRFFEIRYRSTGKTIFRGTHQEIASLLNSSREVISRLLNNLEKSGLVITMRNSIDYSALVKRSSAV